MHRGRETIGGIRVLVVDDDHARCTAAEGLLSRLGITEVESGGALSTAASDVERFDPTLILLHRGVESNEADAVLEQLAAQDQRWMSRAVIVMSDDAGIEARRQALALGAHGVLRGRYHGWELGEAVLSALRSLSRQPASSSYAAAGAC
jgi:DNA-binding NarL/FixJ family response regulator